jgi:hypothetical protein
MSDRMLAVVFCLGLVFTGAAVMFIFTGCNSFKKINSGISDECDVYYTTLRTLGGKGGGTESTAVGIVYPPCKDSIDRLIQKEKDNTCAKEFFPPDGVIDRENLRQYNRYLECRQGK